MSTNTSVAAEYYRGDFNDVLQEVLEDLDVSNINDPVADALREDSDMSDKDDSFKKKTLAYLAGVLWGYSEESVTVEVKGDNVEVISDNTFIPSITVGPWEDFAPNRPTAKGKHSSTLTLKTASADFEVPFDVTPSWIKEDGRAPEGILLESPDGTQTQISIVALPASEGPENYILQQIKAFEANKYDITPSETPWGDALWLNNDGEPAAIILFASGDRWCICVKVLFPDTTEDMSKRLYEAYDIIESCVVHRGKEALAPYATMDMSLMYWEGESR